MARMMEAMLGARAKGELEFHAGTRPNEQAGFSVRTVFQILASGACYYLATRTAWVLTFPDSKVSLFFFPHAVLVAILLLVPTRHWWVYTLAAVGSHFFATQQEHWPPLYALQCEAFDAVKAQRIGKQLGAYGVVLGTIAPKNKLAEAQVRFVKVETAEILIAASQLVRDAAATKDKSEGSSLGVWAGVSTYKEQRNSVRLEIETINGPKFNGSYYWLFNDGEVRHQ